MEKTSMDLNVEYKKEGRFSVFEQKYQAKKVAIVFDKNTKPFAKDFIAKHGKIKFTEVFFDDSDYIPTIENCDIVFEKSKDCDYILAVGSGSLNDTVKYVANRLDVECGVMPTAASMDGYVSKGSALMVAGKKVTETVKTPSDVLIDLDIIANAPKIMTASGFGDIVGKFTCLTDWKLSNIINGEEINAEAFSLMEKARKDCLDLFDELTEYKFDAIAKLIDALITAGVSMAICGNSRPASGSEHHMSHFLEMDFVRRGEKIPMHGIKVAIGTLISIELYNYLKKVDFNLPQKEEIYKLIDELPKVEDVKYMLEKMGCPTRFSMIGVRKETMEEMLEKAYTVRDRYTVLTLYSKIGMTKEIKDLIMSKYF